MKWIYGPLDAYCKYMYMCMLLYTRVRKVCTLDNIQQNFILTL